jgi:hypothetical protein
VVLCVRMWSTGQVQGWRDEHGVNPKHHSTPCNHHVGPRDRGFGASLLRPKLDGPVSLDASPQTGAAIVSAILPVPILLEILDSVSNIEHVVLEDVPYQGTVLPHVRYGLDK